MNFLLKISRPRFWIYLMGPFLIGCLAALQSLPSQSQYLTILTGLLFFSFPANLYLYAVNDMYDYETDKLNPKKQGYETAIDLKKNTSLNILLSYILLLSLGAALLFFESKAQLAALCFFLLAHFYSTPPIRAKAKPFIDMIFNTLYVMPAMLGFYLLGGGELETKWELVLAAIIWSMAMHAYSAIPDIEADKKAGIATTATLLGKKNTLILCFFLFAISALLAFNYFGVFALIASLPYLTLQVFTLFSSKNVLKIYSTLPIINTCVGFAICMYLIIHLL